MLKSTALAGILIRYMHWCTMSYIPLIADHSWAMEVAKTILSRKELEVAPFVAFSPDFETC